MTNSDHRAPKRPSEGTPVLRAQRTTMGYGNGPVIATGVMIAGGLLAVGWSVVHASSEEGFLAALRDDGPVVEATAQPAAEGSGDEEDYVVLPDRNGNGIADVLEESNGGSADSSDTDSSADADGRGDEDSSGQGSDADGEDPPAASDEPEDSEVYLIERGDTLSEISAETGVPIGTLVKANDISDPNLIYAGSALLIPPVD